MKIRKNIKVTILLDSVENMTFDDKTISKRLYRFFTNMSLRGGIATEDGVLIPYSNINLILEEV